MARKPQAKVKVVRINYGLLGNSDQRRVQNAIRKWMSKGYTLEKQNEVRGGCLSPSYSLLTFIQKPD